MFKQLWQWLKKCFRRLLKISFQFSLFKKKKEDTPSQLVKSPRKLTEAEYEFLFFELLEGIDQGWSQGSIKGFLIAKNLSKTDLVMWLCNFGERVLASSIVDDELAIRLLRLSKVADGELVKVAGGIGRKLLEKGKSSNSHEETIENGKDKDLENQDAEKWFGLGMKLLESERYEESIVYFDKVLESKSDNYKAWCKRGISLFNLGDYERAIISFDIALQIKPNYKEAITNKIIAFKNNKIFSSFNKTLSIQLDYVNPQYVLNSDEVFFQQGCELKNSGSSEETITFCDQVLQIKSNEFFAWCNQGDTLYRVGKYEEAIASYDQALQIKPNEYKAWHNKGIILRESGNYKEAIASFKQVLQIRPDYYLAWGNLGLTLSNFEKHHEAISCYEEALQIQPSYHKAWSNKGVALRELGKYEEAIASYDQALQIKPNEYIVWYNKGLTLEKLEKYEEAIICHDRALEIQPNYYEAWYNRGNAFDGLNQYEQAIFSYEQALQIQPDNYASWRNRGISASQSAIHNSFWANLSPITKKNPHKLNQRGYEGELASYQEGFKYIHQNTHPEGWGILHEAIGIAHYSKGKSERYPRPYWLKALESYHKALRTLTAKDFPEEHLKVLQGLIRIHLALGEIEQAEELQRRGTDVYKLLLDECSSPGKRKQLAFKFATFQQLTVDISINLGRVTEALKLAELGKNACLSWILYGYGVEISTSTWEEIQQQFLILQTAIVYWHISPASLHVFILKHGVEVPIIVTTSIATKEDQRLEALKCLDRFENWVSKWNRQYTEYRNQQSDKTEHFWRTEMSQQLASLKNILSIQEIEEHLTGIEQLIIVPHRDLHRFPLHALFSEKFEITYLPSLQMGLSLQKIQRDEAAKPSLLSVEAPNSEGLASLNFAILESGTICKSFPNSKRLQGDVATKEQVATELANSYNAFHFAGHGLYNFHDPKSSELALSGTDRLTLAEIRQQNLSHYQLVTLSACETAITGNQTITTEYVGLVSGFLSMGVSHVVSTLWTVESAASALVMIEFYRRWQAGIHKAKALAKTTHWLKNLTVNELKEWYKNLLSQLSPDEGKIRPFIKTELRKLNKIEQQDKKLYEHPYYWAAFIITGNI